MGNRYDFVQVSPASSGRVSNQREREEAGSEEEEAILANVISPLAANSFCGEYKTANADP